MYWTQLDYSARMAATARDFARKNEESRIENEAANLAAACTAAIRNGMAACPDVWSRYDVDADDAGHALAVWLLERRRF